MNIFQQRLRQAMFFKGIRQKDIVERTGLSDGKISSYVSGRYKPNAESLTKIAKAIDVAPAWLMGEGPDMTYADIPLPEPLHIAESGPEYGSKLSGDEELLIEAWRKADDHQKMLVRLTLYMEALKDANDKPL